MLNNLFQLISRRPPGGGDHGFVQEVRVSQPASRNRRVERLLLLGWVLIALKSGLLVWAVEKYHVPIDPLWVIVPTIIFGLLCTMVYIRGE
jgi:hypothetical protein